MALVIGVRFKSVGKVYYFDPGDNIFKNGELVIVENRAWNRVRRGHNVKPRSGGRAGYKAA